MVGLLRRWDGGRFMVGGVIRRWDGTRFRPDPNFARVTQFNGAGTSYPLDLSSTNAATLLFEAVLYPADGGTHMAIEHQPNSNSNGFFMLTESEFGVPNVMEFDSNSSFGHDIVTCLRPSVGVPHKIAWVMDRTRFPCHQVFIDGVKQPVTSQYGYSSDQAGANFAASTLYVGARAGNQIPAHIDLSDPPTVFLRALSDSEAAQMTATP